MSRAYRATLIGVGVFLFLGGACGMVLAVMMRATAGEHVKSFLGGAIAAAGGAAVVRAAYLERLPAWLARYSPRIPGP